MTDNAPPLPASSGQRRPCAVTIAPPALERESARRRAVSAGVLAFLVAAHGPAWTGELARTGQATGATTGDSAARPAGQAKEWLAKMAQAVVKLSYRGTFVYRSGERLQSVQITRRNDENGTRERLLSLTGLPTEVLRDESKVICILPRTQAAVKPDVLRGAARPRDLQLEAVLLGKAALDAHYEFNLLAEHGRVAGRETVELEVKPRDEYRYGYMLSLDRETALPLKSDLVSHDGEVLEEILYTDIDFDSEVTDEMLESKHSDAVIVSESNIREMHPQSAVGVSASESGWQAAWLPAGFEPKAPLGGAEPQASTNAGGSKQHLVFTDGVATMSVFIEPLSGSGPALNGPSAMGATHAFATTQHNRQIISVGRVPPATVEKVALKVRLK